jgi:DNA-binding LytR/AlgR family response regulator
MKTTIRAIIVDDEELARQMIREYLADFPAVETCAECSNGKDAVRTLNRQQPHLLFLDIQMPELNGFEVLQRLEVIPFVIFSTAYDKYALQAFEVNAVDYLLKPYDRSRFGLAMQRVLERMQNSDSGLANLMSLLNSLHGEKRESGRLWIKDSGCIKPVMLSEIDWMEAMDDYVCVHVGKTKHLINLRMQELESRLNEKMFLRIHRSTIVNLDRIKELRPAGDGSYQVILKDGTQLSLSRGQAKRFRDLLTF